jgi:hypothetical protein
MVNRERGEPSGTRCFDGLRVINRLRTTLNWRGGFATLAAYAPRFVACQQVGHRATAGLIFKIDIGERPGR